MEKGEKLSEFQLICEYGNLILYFNKTTSEQKLRIIFGFFHFFVFMKYFHFHCVKSHVQVVFTDESLFHCGERRVAKVWQSPGSQASIVQRRAHPQKLMVWGLISVHGSGKLVPIEGTLRKESYLEILKTHYQSQMVSWTQNGPLKLLHDGAPCHKAHIITQFLEENGIDVVEWPGNSPDLNPIENVWACVKKKVYKNDINTKEELLNILQTVWENDSVVLACIQSSIESMPKRVNDVFIAKGGHTKY